jgi:pyrroline-5-carboxylate reductase
MSAFCLGTRTTASDRRIVVRQLSAFGAALELPEEQFDAVTALSGSGPAFFAYVLDALVDSAEKQGLQRDHALLLAEQTMYGTAKLLKEQKIAPQDLIESVASAKGTTAAGLSVLDESTIRAVLHRTLAAAARRSRELSAG